MSCAGWQPVVRRGSLPRQIDDRRLPLRLVRDLEQLGVLEAEGRREQVGRKYLLREGAGPEEEVIQIASITTNVKATAQNNLKFDYLAGDKFRSIDYFPKMVSLDKNKPWRQNLTTWSLKHQMTEDRG